MPDMNLTAKTDVYGTSFGLVREGQKFSVPEDEGRQLVAAGHAEEGDHGEERPTERPHGEPIAQPPKPAEEAPPAEELPPAEPEPKAEPAPANKAAKAPKNKAVEE